MSNSNDITPEITCLTVERVADCLRPLLEQEYTLLTWFTDVIEDPDCSTFCINRNGVIKYNKDFLKNLRTTEELRLVLLHELAHNILQHFDAEEQDEFHTLAQEICCNVVALKFGKLVSGDFLTRFYKGIGLQLLLQPDSKKTKGTKLHNLHKAIWDYGNITSTKELATILRRLWSKDDVRNIQAIMIGDHVKDKKKGNENGEKEGSGKGVPEIPLPSRQGTRLSVEDIGKIRGVFSKIRDAGTGYGMIQDLVHVIFGPLGIKEQVLRRFSTVSREAAFWRPASRLSSSPVPVSLSRRDSMLLAGDFYPMFFKRARVGPNKQGNVSLFFDVSGSVLSELPNLIGYLNRHHEMISDVFLFSTVVVKTTLVKLLTGKIETSGGTDFNCIAEKIKEKKIKKALVITDGWANMSTENRIAIKNVKMLTLISGDIPRSCPLADFGELIPISQVLE